MYETFCPMARRFYTDPVVAEDGVTYDRPVIERWIDRHGTSPRTWQPLSKAQLKPDKKMRSLLMLISKVFVFDELEQREVHFIVEAIENPKNCPSCTRLDRRLK
jgi:hypothetical protein